MRTLELTSAAQLYIALFWEKVTFQTDRKQLQVASGSALLLDLFREAVGIHKEGIIALLVEGKKLADQRPGIIAEARELCRSAARNWQTEARAFADAVEFVRVRTQPETPRGGPCEHCGLGKGHGQMQIRDYGRLPHVRLHPRCREDWALVREALATVALADMQDTLPVGAEHDDQVIHAVRQHVLAALGISAIELGLARRHPIQRRGLLPPRHENGARRTQAAVELDALVSVLRDRKGMALDAAKDLARRSLGEALSKIMEDA